MITITQTNKDKSGVLLNFTNEFSVIKRFTQKMKIIVVARYRKWKFVYNLLNGFASKINWCRLNQIRA